MKNNKSNNNNTTSPALLEKTKLTFGQRSSDRLSEFMGSWPFLGLFFFFLLVWMALNFVAWRYQWDPYPFILLNLALSLISAIQAPIILMSENRQTDRDRLSAKYDYAVNRKAEREIQNIQKDLNSIKRLLKKSLEQNKQNKK